MFFGLFPIQYFILERKPILGIGLWIFKPRLLEIQGIKLGSKCEYLKTAEFLNC